MKKIEDCDNHIIGEKYKTDKGDTGKAEVIKELYEQNNFDGIWSVHLDDVELPFEVEDWMYAYAMSLQPREKEEI